MTETCLYSHIPGKSDDRGRWLPLKMHLSDTAAAILFLFKHRIPNSVISACGLTREEFRKVCIFLAMIHDIGKCTPLFAAKILPHIPFLREILSRFGLNVPTMDSFLHSRESPHARAGEAILEAFGCPDGIRSVVGAHHGKPTSAAEVNSDQLDVYSQNYYAGQRELWEKLQELVLEDALREAGYSSVKELPILSNCAQMLLCGILIQADWIASNQTYFPLLSDEEPFPEKLPDSDFDSVRSAEAMEKLALPDSWKEWRGYSGSEAFYTERFGFSPNAMQKRTAEIAASAESPGLMIVEAQMGTGKTEAAMAAAELFSEKAGCGGVFFGLPTQATSNGLFPRAADWADKLSQNGKHAIRLVHGLAELNEDYQTYFPCETAADEEEQSGLIAHSWFAGKKQALLADFVIGTVDTALMAALAQKHVMLRHLGLCGKTVIIDECHAYDAYMSRFLDRMLQWLGAYRVPVILLSATLPPKRKAEMLFAYTKPYKKAKKLPLPEEAGYPLITWTEGEKVKAAAIPDSFASSCVRIRRMEEEALEDDLREKLKDGGCAGIIVNTVRRAQEISERLKNAFPDYTVAVYHAQFLAEERIRREKELMDRIGKTSTARTRDRVIVVGTQVLEQSLDIDFDILITDLCPMDLLLQRIGRLHRHRRERPAALAEPQCSVMWAGEEFESGARTIYGEWLLKQTKRFLPGTINLPADIPVLVSQVYADAEEDEEDPAWEEYKQRRGNQKSRAGSWTLKAPKEYDEEEETENSIVGMLDLAVESEKRAEASVRDGMESVDVLVMRRTEDGHIGFLPWISDAVLRADTLPSEEECRKIALQRLRLPFALCCGKRMDEVIGALEAENREFLSVWQDSPWLRGELVLLLDPAGEKELCGFRLKYEKDQGLTYEKEGN